MAAGILNTIIRGDVRNCLGKIDTNSVQMIFTSPPYFRLRFYGTEYQIWGGLQTCNHYWTTYKDKGVTGGTNSKKNSIKGSNNFQQAVPVKPFAFCDKCGAWYGELGWEKTPIEFAKHLTQVFREAKRPLREDGTCWVVISDTYLPNKCMALAPEKFAGLMIKDGWILRNKVIWHKPQVFGNPVQDRFIQDWEYVYVFSQSKSYYFDQDSVRLPPKLTSRDLAKMKMQKHKGTRYNDSNAPGTLVSASRPIGEAYGSIKKIKGANRRCMWSIPVEKTKLPHFAPFPRKLCRIGIKAGSKEGDTVLDCFCGVGNTLIAAKQLNRNVIGIDLNPTFVDLSKSFVEKDRTLGRFLK